MQCISRNIAVTHVHKFQNRGERCDFIGGIINGNLPENNTLLNGSRADHAQIGEIIIWVHRMMYFFTIKRNVLRIELRERRLQPGNKTALNCFWVNACKHATKRIM